MAGTKKRYPGIRSFEETEAQLFFGRKKEARQLYSLVKAKSSVVLFAKSGIGKSSLINAGLIPLLEKHLFREVKVRLQDKRVSPVENIKSALAEFLDEDLLKKYGETDAKNARLWEYIRSCKFPRLVEEEEIVPIIIFDQFEEFFDHEAAAQDILLEELSDLLSERLPERIQDKLREIPRKQRTKEQIAWHTPFLFKVLFAIRSDRLSLMDGMAKRIPTILYNRFHLKPMVTDQAKEAIIEPAKLEGSQFETAPFGYEAKAIQKILTHLSNKKGEIESFQLQLVCQHIEKKLKELKSEANYQVKESLYEGEAGLKRILNDYYENEIAELLPEERAIAKKFIEEGLIVAGKRVGITEGVEKEHYQVNETLLAKLLESRLIRVENTHLGKSFEVSHDAMVAPIAASYEKRRIIEEKAAKDAEIRRVRRQFLIAGSIALTGIILSAIATFFYFRSKKSEAEAAQKRKEAERLLQVVLDKQRQNAIERCKRFVETGKTLMEKRAFNAAITEFEKAIQAIQDYREDLVAVDASKELETCIADAEKLIQESLASGGLKGAFDNAIARGEMLANGGDYLGARGAFKRALDIGYDNRTAQNKVNANEVILDDEYKKFIRKGDTFFETAKGTTNKQAYQDAYDNYTQAAARFPLKGRAKENLKKCQSVLGK